jgi:hypothetical protein
VVGCLAALEKSGAFLFGTAGLRKSGLRLEEVRLEAQQQQPEVSLSVPHASSLKPQAFALLCVLCALCGEDFSLPSCPIRTSSFNRVSGFGLRISGLPRPSTLDLRPSCAIRASPLNRALTPFLLYFATLLLCDFATPTLRSALPVHEF